jgi:hypothetical protein
MRFKLVLEVALCHAAATVVLFDTFQHMRATLLHRSGHATCAQAATAVDVQSLLQVLASSAYVELCHPPLILRCQYNAVSLQCLLCILLETAGEGQHCV